MSLSVEVRCSRCNQIVVTVSLFSAGEGEGMWKDQDRLERQGFTGSIAKFGTESVKPLFEAIVRNDFEAARNFDFDFVAFHCRQCNKVYCKNCWDIGSPEFDEGFYDCTFGTCPEGHNQVVDD